MKKEKQTNNFITFDFDDDDDDNTHTHTPHACEKPKSSSFSSIPIGIIYYRHVLFSI